MALKDIKIPLYSDLGDDRNHELMINEFAGRILLNIKDGENEIEIECYFEDIERAWNAVKKYGW